eukprot:m.310191 g.310191  ORF g.310191 m.310191 type:complete len:1075 (+) comp50132_c0_seq1:55-3279(+)
MQPRQSQFVGPGFTPSPGRLGHSLPTPYVLNSPIFATLPAFGRYGTPQQARRCFNVNGGEVDSAADSLSQLKLGPDKFGSPSYPRALDSVRSRRFGGLDESMGTVEDTFEDAIDDFRDFRDLRSPEIRLEDFSGDGMNAVSYAQGFSRGSFARTNDDPQRPSSALSQSWRFHSFVGGAEVGVLFPSTVRNPNKALVTVDGDTVVLIANEMACELFGYSREKIVGMRLKELFASPFREKQEYLVEEHIDTKGRTVMVNGKVVDAIDSTGTPFPVSMWMKKIATEPEVRCIVVLEPVERTIALVDINENGCIVACDEKFICLGGYPSMDEVIGKSLTDYVPGFKVPQGPDMPKDVKKQQATCRTHEGTAIPLSVAIQPMEEEGDIVYKILLSTFDNISGMLSFFPGGKLHGYNENFTRLMFGYGKKELQGKDITFLIPEFFHFVTDGLLDSGSLPLPPFDDDAIPASSVQRINTSAVTQPSSSSLGSMSLEGQSNQSQISKSEQQRPISPRNDSGVASAPMQQDQQETQMHFSPNKSQGKEVSFHDVAVKPADFSIKRECLDELAAKAMTSTPARPIDSSSMIEESPLLQSVEDSRASSRASAVSKANVLEGSFVGYGKHKDGLTIPVVFDVKRVDLDGGGFIYCVWVSRNVVMETNRDKSFLDWSVSFAQPLESSNRYKEGISASYLSAVEEHPSESCPFIEDGSPGTLEEAAAYRGDYDKDYCTLTSIGKGAFGFVKLAQKKGAFEMAVVKFIRKCRVLDECWFDPPGGKRMPLEIHLLQILDHPNIVKLIGLYENEEFYQMVMEKHGDGIDLFDFIDRGPAMDECLASYLFRQIVAAVEYLHSLNITHRDIKDENVIVDRKFHCKLIDFGSAAFMKKGKLFGTFCGTMEYCSPEVLLGNKYPGPELECWSLGVTLYTMVFGENPFFDVEETIRARFQPPYVVSSALLHLLMCVLHPDPMARSTVQQMGSHKWVIQPYDPSKYSWETVFPGARSESALLEDIQEENVREDNANDNSNCSRQVAASGEEGEITSSDSEGEKLQEELKKQYEESDRIDIQTDHMDISQEMNSKMEG